MFSRLFGGLKGEAEWPLEYDYSRATVSRIPLRKKKKPKISYFKGFVLVNNKKVALDRYV